MRFETLTGAKITTHGTCSDRTDYFVLELEKVRKGQNKIYTGERHKVTLHIVKNVRFQLLYVVGNKHFYSRAPT